MRKRKKGVEDGKKLWARVVEKMRSMKIRGKEKVNREYPFLV